ncbi:MAG: hypothetical protein PHT69_16125 [Bacteroidales bacterium]|nr:hypothetical protein [Bacteroidales bacterium]
MEEIKALPNYEIVPFLEKTKDFISSLKKIVTIDEVRVPPSEEGPEKTYQIKAFYYADLICLNEKETHFNRGSVLNKCCNFAENWVYVLDETIEKVNYLINKIELTLENLTPHLLSNQNIKDKIKSTLSVDELAYFFRILVDEKIFIIPEGKLESFYRFVADNFSTKMKTDISFKSFKGKYLSHENKTASSVHAHLRRLLQITGKYK